MLGVAVSCDWAVSTNRGAGEWPAPFEGGSSELPCREALHQRGLLESARIGLSVRLANSGGAFASSEAVSFVIAYWKIGKM